MWIAGANRASPCEERVGAGKRAPEQQIDQAAHERRFRNDESVAVSSEDPRHVVVVYRDSTTPPSPNLLCGPRAARSRPAPEAETRRTDPRPSRAKAPARGHYPVPAPSTPSFTVAANSTFWNIGTPYTHSPAASSIRRVAPALFHRRLSVHRRTVYHLDPLDDSNAQRLRASVVIPPSRTARWQSRWTRIRPRRAAASIAAR